ncbi:MAG: proteasome assembly chaperone family protein [Candidatus Marsarchaeota archaeon]|nr:proteasome assembly chaperone family protein [Candidatus Marsarchaeota archaeon]
MDKTTIITNRKVRLNKPILVVGLPGIGHVGKLVANQLIKEFKGKRFATMYSPHFPHQVVMRRDGTIRLVSNRFYVLKPKSAGSDIVILTGDVQAVTPEGQYETNSKIVEYFAKELKGSFVYTIGGYSVGAPIAATPKVFGNVTRKEIAEQFKGQGILFGKSRGMIWGSAGLILAFAKQDKVSGICLMGETGFLEVDPAAAKSVLTVLAKKLGLKIDMTNIDEKINETARALSALEQKVALGLQQEQQNAPQAPQPSKGPSEQPSYIR